MPSEAKLFAMLSDELTEGTAEICFIVRHDADDAHIAGKGLEQSEFRRESCHPGFDPIDERAFPSRKCRPQRRLFTKWHDCSWQPKIWEMPVRFNALEAESKQHSPTFCRQAVVQPAP